MKVLKSKSGFWLSVGFAVAVSAVLAFSVMSLFAVDPPPFYIINDLNGADDVPGQKDLTRMGRYDDPAGFLDIFWSWDEGISGAGQTLDACALFDSDGDGYVNYAICGQVASDFKQTSISPKAYSCDDTAKFNCLTPISLNPAGDDLVAGTLAGLVPDGDLRTNTDPFGSDQAPMDVTLRVRINKMLLADSVLTNVCTYPSGSTSSAYSDCVSNEGGGFLRVVKNTSGGDGSFTFKVNPVTDGTGDNCPQGDPSTCRSYNVATTDGTGEFLIGAAANAILSVTEVIPSGWTLGTPICQVEGQESTTGSYDSNGTMSGIPIVSGKFTTCTFTNAKQPAELTVTKVVINDNGGTATVGDFTLMVGATVVTSGQQTQIPAGDYVVSETGGPEGYVGSFDGDCAADGSIHMEPGQTYACTVTNNDVAPSLTLSKIVVNDNGGNASGTSWTLSAACTTASACGSAVLSGPGGAASTSSFKAGTYSLSESGGPSGYTAGDWSCSGGVQAGSSITLALGQSATCTITNDDEQATLIVRKVVVNDNGGTAVATDFSFKVDGGPSTAFQQDGANPLAGKNSIPLAPGTYTISESPVAGYAVSYSSDCVDVSVDLGETKTCTVTNDDIAPQLTLVKYVNNTTSNDAHKTPADFVLSATGAVGSFAGATGVTSGPAFSAGTYTLSEANTEGYVASAWSCDSGILTGNSLTLSLGQVATCSILNTAVNLPPVIKVEKTATPKNLDSTGGTVTFTVKVTNLSGSYDPVTIVSLGDDIYGDPAVLADAKLQATTGCADAVIPKLESGESYTCSWTVEFPPLPANETFSETDIVTVEVVDDEGSKTEASDSATVTQSLPIIITDGPCVLETFRRIFSQDSAYHYTATNSGQFFYNLSISGNKGEVRHVTLELPWPFVTQGSQPVHVYDSVEFEDGCFKNMNGAYSFDKHVYLKDYGVNYPTEKTGYLPELKTRKVELEITIPDSGFAFIRQHMDDGLKEPNVDVDGDGVLDFISYGKDNADNATDPNNGKTLIPELYVHPFSMWGYKCSAENPSCIIDPSSTDLAISGGTSIKNDNDFQKNVGVQGIVQYQLSESVSVLVSGMTVELWRGSTFIGSAITDANGSYTIAHKHTGRAADYTVVLVDPFLVVGTLGGPGTISGWTIGQPPGTMQNVTIKANGVVRADFPLVP